MQLLFAVFVFISLFQEQNSLFFYKWIKTTTQTNRSERTTQTERTECTDEYKIKEFYFDFEQEDDENMRYNLLSMNFLLFQ
jgi:hypothetical protein